jgi:UDP-N-acetylglucosamine 2-epimerase (non-hydrolysing)
MHNILLVFGTRPEAIKMAPIINKLKEYDSEFNAIVCVTAQHRQMLDQVLSLFDIHPQHDLDIMKKNQDLFDITARLLKGLKKVLKVTGPDLVLVQGDTTTAFTAGLAAYYMKIPVGHIEAGLRTYDKYSPFPEEANRHLLSVLSDFHFPPTEWSRSNLLQEGISPDKIWVTGNTVLDALSAIVEIQKTEDRKKNLVKYFQERWKIAVDDLNAKIILVTGHRRENFGQGFQNICLALKSIAEKRKDVVIVYPVHLNPNVQEPVKRILSGLDNVDLIDPLEYEQFVFLMSNAYTILTDSGGIQEEAPFLGKPVLVMRNTTERPEGVEAGVVKLVGTEKDRIVENTIELLDNPELYRKMSEAVSPYGDGKASEKIIDVLRTVLQ